ncbi:hypothetical protein QTP88_020253 [Uroleucon formosanum]
MESNRLTNKNSKRSFSGPALITISINIEGISPNKEDILAQLCKETSCNVLCIQETHRGNESRTPKISGMRLAAIRSHKKYGSAIFTKPSIDIISSEMTEVDDIEIITIDLGKCTVKSVYKPPNSPFKFHKPKNFAAPNVRIFLGDFNCHSTSWGYSETNDDGHALEAWAVSEELSLIHDHKLPPSFNSGRWKRGYNPDLIFVSEATREYNKDPFSTQTIEEGMKTLNAVSETRRKRWCEETLENVDMRHDSRKAWGLLRRLGNIPRRQPTPPKKKKMVRESCKETDYLSKQFNSFELQKAIDVMKNYKAAGPDDICTEQLRNLGPGAKKWETDPKNYRPISLLCHTYKIYERMLLNRLMPVVDKELILEQSGFRPGKSCSSQILNLTQYIENGFENKQITGVAFVELSAAYDTVNHNIMLTKLYKMTYDYNFVKIIEALLSNRRFFVTFDGKNSRWRNLKNGLPQGSVLAPTLFNIYTNDQPISNDANIKHYIYADDSAIAVQDNTFEIIERKLSDTLARMDEYFEANTLRPNPSKTEVCAFHLRNKEANRKLHVTWKGVELVNNPNPKYLGVVLDRSLT